MDCPKREVLAEIGPAMKYVAKTLPVAPFEKDLWLTLGISFQNSIYALGIILARFLCLFMYPLSILLFTPLVAVYRVQTDKNEKRAAEDFINSLGR